MSNPESFIEEVTEEVRRERLFALMRRWGWLGILAVLLLVGGAAFNEWRKARDMAAAQALGDALLAAQTAPDPAGALAGLAADGTPAEAAVLVDFLLAEQELAAGDTQAAAARLEARAATPDLPGLWRDLAALRAVALRRTLGQSPEARRLALTPLAAPGRPYRLLAIEELALIDLETGDRPGAIARLREILADAETTADLRERTRAALTALGALQEG